MATRLKCVNGHDLCYLGVQDDCPYCEVIEVCSECGRNLDTEGRCVQCEKDDEADRKRQDV